jgi:D-psicose/D-tagatose/L-ribulose 3-epimerase
MRFAASALLWTPAFAPAHFDLLPPIREHGFDGFEVAFFEPARVETAAIRRALDRNELGCLACHLLPAGMNPTSGDRGVRARTRTHLKECIAAAAEMGARTLGGPVCAPVGYLPGRRRNADEWRWAVECFQSLGETLREYDVALAIEPLNRFETYFLNTAEDALALCREIGEANVGVLLDTFHTNIEERDVAAAFRGAGARLKHVQACENDRGIPGTGHVDFPGIAHALAAIGYDGWITIESLGAWSELASAAAIWRDLAPTPESIAFEGLRYLHPLMRGVGRNGHLEDS